jgi:ATP-binding cassette subfamily B protein
VTLEPQTTKPQATRPAASPMPALWRIVNRHRALIVETATLDALLHLLRLVPPIAFGLVLDKVLSARATATLATITAILVIAAIAEAAFARLQHAASDELRDALDVIVRDTLGALPAPRAGRVDGAASAAMLRRLEAAADIVIELCTSLTVAALVVPAIILAIAIASPLLAAIVGAATLLQAVLVLVLRGTQRRRARIAARAEDRVDRLFAVGWTPDTLSAALRERRRGTAALHGLRHDGKQLAATAARIASTAMLTIGALEMIAGNLTVGGFVASSMLLRQMQGVVERALPLAQRHAEIVGGLERALRPRPTPIAAESRPAARAIVGGAS